MDAKARLEALADVIARRKEPLGTDFSSQCWGAVAESMALRHNAQPCDYFQISPDVYQAAIRMNRVLPAQQRNAVMRSFTRALAKAAPAAPLTVG